MGWFSSAINVAKNIGKTVASGVAKAGKVYDKAKSFYTGAKEAASNLPIVGGVASELIGKGEDYLNKKLMEKSGLSASDIDQKLNEARAAVGNYSSSM
jgi:hypothetical protein